MRKLRLRVVQYNFAQVRELTVSCRAGIHTVSLTSEPVLAPTYEIVFMVSYQCIKKGPSFPLESELYFRIDELGKIK